MADETILFADLAGFTALTEAHGDESAVAIVSEFFDLVTSIARNKAQVIKTIGDAVMLASESSDQLLGVALELHAATSSRTSFLALRSGLHTGPVIVKNGDRFGGTVNLAARVAAYARAGQVLGTASVRHDLRSENAQAVSLGAVTLRPFADEVELYNSQPEPMRVPTS